MSTSVVQVNNIVSVTNPETKVVTTNTPSSNIVVQDAQTQVVTVNSPGTIGPQGPQGPQGPSGSGVAPEGTISSSAQIVEFGFALTGSNVVFNTITASGDISASSFIGDGSQLTGVTSEVPAGTVSSSIQITELGFVTSSATASFVLNSQTSSMSVLSSSYALTASYALNSESLPDGVVSSSAQITELGFVTSSATASFVTNDQTGSFAITGSDVIFNDITASNISASGYISASSFIGDGSQLTGVASFPFTGSAKITGSLIVTGSSILSGSVILNDLIYPTTNGEDGEVLTTDGLGNVFFGHPEKLHLQARNDNGVDIPAGTPVYSTGEIGGSSRIKVRIASASDASTMPAIGIAETTLTTTGGTQDGFVIINGVYNNNITPVGSSPSLGDTLYVHCDGGLTVNKPSGSNLIQNIGTVLKTNGTVIQGIKVSSIDRTNDVPNLHHNNIFYGSGSNQSYQTHISGALDSTIINNITASGNISSSGIVYGKTGSFSALQGNSPINVLDSITFQQPITASADIITTGNIYGSNEFVRVVDNEKHDGVIISSSTYMGDPRGTSIRTSGRGFDLYINDGIDDSNIISSNGDNIGIGYDSQNVPGTNFLNVNGDISASAFVGDGSQLTGVTSTLPAGIISSSIQINELGFVTSSATASFAVTGSSIIFNDITASNISASGYISASNFIGDGSELTNLQRPISLSVSSHMTASNDNAGFFFEVGVVTCSIQATTSVSCDVGSEFEFFQSSSGNFIFVTGSGVTLRSKGGALTLTGPYSGATLKKIRDNEWILVGDLV